MWTFIGLVVTWVVVSLILELLNRKVFQIKGVPAWAITIVACLAASLILNVLVNVFPWSPWNVFTLMAIVFLGAHAVFTLLVKPYFPTRAA